ncbi:hypothetical protein S4A8_04463 [Salinisphaera sp. S4-8]|uniref:AAA family ATPase n=1 Tax=Salinisphaera sp. S4-8 TaxID=633357 RepID=UPI00334194B6
MRPQPGTRHVILSGCSGGGKSTLLAALRRRGYATVEEPGRRIVAEQMRGDGDALPWVDLEAFARRAIKLAIADRAHAGPNPDSWVFFDRGLVDAAAALAHATGAPVASTLADHRRFHSQVFLTPPWPALYQTDAVRRQTLDDSIAEYHRLVATYEQLGYTRIILPKVDVETRADFVLQHLY